jgi:chaperonin GroES
VSTKIRPLGDRVVVLRKIEEERSVGGIIIPDSAKEKPMEGTVLAVGPGKRLENGDRVQPDVKVGDVVLFGKYAGTEVKIGQEEWVVMREDDIMGVVA